MKKTYITPETKAYVIAVNNQLLAGSTTSVNVSSESYEESTMTDLSRGFNFDDDFDEE